MSDPGLQPERTDLAWHRTALAAAACSLLLLGVAARQGLTVIALLPAGLTGAAALVLALLGRGSPGPRRIPLALVAFFVTAACVAALPVAI